MVLYRSSSPLGTQNIRLLTLSPGQFLDEIKSTLSVASSENPPDYETLSYVWGNPTSTRNITIDGNQFAATANLASALRHIRHANVAKVLWIDAICINQRDEAEKINQIRKMAEIYQKSSRVLIWLGEMNSSDISQTDVQAFFDFMKRVATKDDNINISIERHLPVLEAMMESAWWTRIWTAQEAIIPNAALVHWGFCSLAWDILDIAREELFQNAHQTKNAKILDKSGTFFKFKSAVRSVTRAREGVTFYEMLWRFRDRNATEPQDKVFGLLGLIPASQRHLFHIYDRGYERDMVKVCFRIVVDLINAQGNLQCLIGLGGGPQPNPKMPSWVWDWSTYPHGHNTTICHSFWNHLNADAWYSASQGKPLVWKANEDDLSLSLTGIKIGRVEWLYELPTPFHDSGATVRSTDIVLDLDSGGHVNIPLIRSVLQLLKAQVYMTQKYHNTNKTYEEVFWHNMFCGLITKVNGSPPFRRASETDEAALKEMIESGACDSVRPDGYYGDCVCQSIIAYCGSHKVFLSSRGYLGVGPKFARRDDEVWILLGGNTPYLLRRLPVDEETKQARYIFIGECYVYGLMGGEAMETPDLEASLETVNLY